jgi:hypothetical protein
MCARGRSSSSSSPEPIRFPQAAQRSAHAGTAARGHCWLGSLHGPLHPAPSPPPSPPPAWPTPRRPPTAPSSPGATSPGSSSTARAAGATPRSLTTSAPLRSRCPSHAPLHSLLAAVGLGHVMMLAGQGCHAQPEAAPAPALCLPPSALPCHSSPQGAAPPLLTHRPPAPAALAAPTTAGAGPCAMRSPSSTAPTSAPAGACATTASASATRCAAAGAGADPLAPPRPGPRAQRPSGCSSRALQCTAAVPCALACCCGCGRLAFQAASAPLRPPDPTTPSMPPPAAGLARHGLQRAHPGGGRPGRHAAPRAG